MRDATDEVFGDGVLDTFRAISTDSGEAALVLRAALRALPPERSLIAAYERPAREVGRIVSAAAASKSEPHPSRRRALAIAELVLTMPERVRALQLPRDVLELYPRTLHMIASHIRSNPDEAYPSDFDDAFVKDVHLALGLSVPCGAQTVDLSGRLKLRSLVKHAVVTGDVRPFVCLARRAIGSPWFGIHTDSRDVADFNESGWERCYRRIAGLLVLRPAVAGMVSSSWFYDPQLSEVSPRLSYLQETPLRHGAIAIRNGPAAINTARATATSETRRRLHAEGRYLPVGYTIAWPREELLRWADGR